MRSGHGGIVFLCGEAGQGKSALVHEWTAKLGDECLAAYSPCSIPVSDADVGFMEPLRPWGNVLRQITAAESARSLIERYAPAWQGAGGSPPAFADTSQRNPNASNQAQVFQQFGNLLQEAARHTPLVITLDDIHCADASSLLLLHHLAGHIAPHAVLVIATYRPEDALEAQDTHGHPLLSLKNAILAAGHGHEMSLGELSSTAIRAVLQAHFPTYVPDDRMEHWLHKISHGNALYVTQYILMLRERELLSDSGAFLGEYRDLHPPATAFDVVKLRTAHLSATSRTILQYATGHGVAFTPTILARLTRRAPLDVIQVLDNAERQGVVRTIPQRDAGAGLPTTTFSFSHALMQKALYEGLDSADRNRLHAACFQTLKEEWERSRRAPQFPVDTALTLIVHAQRCNAWDTVAEVALATGRAIWRSFGEQETLGMVDHVLAACEAGTGLDRYRAEALCLRGGVHQLRARTQHALADLQTAEQVFRSAGYAAQAVDAINEQSSCLFQIAHYDASLAAAGRALEESRAIGDAKGEARAFLNFGNAHSARGAYDESARAYKECLAANVAIGNRSGEAYVRVNLGVLYASWGTYPDALACYEAAAVILAELGDRRAEAVVKDNIGNVQSSLGMHEQALESHQQSLAVNIAIGDRVSEARVQNNLGCTLVRIDRHDDALRSFQASAATCIAIDDSVGEGRAVNNIGAILMQRGEFDEARKQFERCLEIYTSVGDLSGEAVTLGHLGELLFKTGQCAESRHVLEKSLAILEEMGALPYQGFCCALLGRTLEGEASSMQGDDRRAALQRAATYLQRCADIRTETGEQALDAFEGDLRRVKALLAETP